MTIIITQWQHFRWWKSWGRSWGLGWCLTLFMLKISRFVSLRPHIFTISPTDMKLLNHEHRVRIQTSDEYRITHSYRDREGNKNERLKDIKQWLFFFISGKHHLVSRTDFEVSWFRISNRQCLLLRCWFSPIKYGRQAPFIFQPLIYQYVPFLLWYSTSHFLWPYKEKFLNPFTMG